MIKKLMLILLVMVTILNVHNSMASIQGFFLGNRDASKEFEVIGSQACHDYGLVGCQIKRLEPRWFSNMIKSVITSCPGIGNSVWIDHDVYERASAAEKKFCVYHEIGHVKHRDPLKNVTVYGLLGLIIAGTAVKAYSRMPKWLYATVLAGQTALGGILAVRFSRQTEKSADLLAAKALRNAHQQDVVEQHVDSLMTHAGSASFIYPSVQEQIDYFKPYIQG